MVIIRTGCCLAFVGGRVEEKSSLTRIIVRARLACLSTSIPSRVTRTRLAFTRRIVQHWLVTAANHFLAVSSHVAPSISRRAWWQTLFSNWRIVGLTSRARLTLVCVWV